MKRREGEHPFGDKGQLIAFVLFIAAWAADSFYFRFFPQFRAYIPLLVRISIGLVLLIFAFVLVKDGHRVLTEDGRVIKLITDGFFRFSRHPVYLGILVFYLALSVLTVSVLSLLLLPFIFIYYDFIARYEEKYLYLKFGETYLNYWKQTPKWFVLKNKLKNPPE
ncbi:hypothetical protein DRI50_10450 [candidate division KSB1 bacterium]|nr:MAG: hypothetical protein DRI50_10450 [candidate division KSB1 bacterium]